MAWKRQRRTPRTTGRGFLDPDERMVIDNTGSDLKYLEAYSARYPREQEAPCGALS
jgi:hypothetical protein